MGGHPSLFEELAIGHGHQHTNIFLSVYTIHTVCRFYLIAKLLLDQKRQEQVTTYLRPTEPDLGGIRKVVGKIKFS